MTRTAPRASQRSMHPFIDIAALEPPAASPSPARSSVERTRQTAAGRLLAELARDPVIELATIARHLGVEESLLEQCRGGHVALPPAVQMRLAALVLLLAPRHDRRARSLYAQAQAALRLEQAEIEGHLTYPRERFR